MANNWFKTGDEGEKWAQEEQKRVTERIQSTRRFWLKPGGEALVTFLDTVGFYVYEHNLKLRGKWNNFFTCLQEFDNCPICTAGFNPYMGCVYTVIDHTKFKTKAGKEVKNQKKLLVVKKTANDILIDRKRNDLDGDLTFALMRTKRHKDDDPNTGADWTFKKRLDQETMRKLIPTDLDDDERESYLKPFDYTKIFAPKTAAELTAIVGGTPPVGSADYSSGSSDGDSSVNVDDIEELI